MGESAATGQLDWQARVRYGLEQVRMIVGKVWPYLLVGIGGGAAIHGYVPEGLLPGVMGKDNWWGRPGCGAAGPAPLL